MTASTWETFTLDGRDYTARPCPCCWQNPSVCFGLGRDGAACCADCVTTGPAVMHDRRAVDDPLLVPGTGWRLAPPGKDPDGWDSEQLRAFIVCSLRGGDMKAVVGAIHQLAVKDPDAAQGVLDAFDIAQAIHASEERH